MSIGGFRDNLSQTILAGIILVGRFGAPILAGLRVAAASLRSRNPLRTAEHPEFNGWGTPFTRGKSSP